MPKRRRASLQIEENAYSESASNSHHHKPTLTKMLPVEDFKLQKFNSLYGQKFIDNDNVLNRIMEIIESNHKDRLFLFCQSRGYGKTRTALELCQLRKGIFLSFGKAENAQPVRTKFILDCDELKFSTEGPEFQTWLSAIYNYWLLLNEKYQVGEDNTAFLKGQKIHVGGNEEDFTIAISKPELPSRNIGQCITLFFDEAHHLLTDKQYDFSSFLTTINECHESLLELNMKIVLLSTNTTLANFMNARGLRTGAIKPLVFSYFDIGLHTSETSNWFNLGRPYFSQAALHPTVAERARLVAIYANLLDKEAINKDKSIYDIRNLASAAIRLSIDIMPVHRIASTLVNRHMATLLYIGSNGESAVVRYPSEPLLVEAAAYCWYHADYRDNHLLKIIEGLELSHLSGLVLKGERGELMAKIVFLLAADSEHQRMAREKETLSICYHNEILLENFMNSLVGNDIYTCTEKMNAARLRLSHWLLLDMEEIDSSILANMYARGCGGMFKFNNKASDLLVPLFLPESNSYGAILIQAKCWQKAQTNGRINISFNMIIKNNNMKSIPTSDCVYILYDAASEPSEPIKFVVNKIECYYVPIFGNKIDLVIQNQLESALLRMVSPQFTNKMPNPIGKEPLPSNYLCAREKAIIH